MRQKFYNRKTLGLGDLEHRIRVFFIPCWATPILTTMWYKYGSKISRTTKERQTNNIELILSEVWS